MVTVEILFIIILKNVLQKNSHSLRIRRDKSIVSLIESGE